MRSRLAVTVMTAVVLLYMFTAGQRAVAFIETGNIWGCIIGIALLILPCIGLWAIIREIMFGIRSHRLFQQLEDEGNLPTENVSLRPSGRPERQEVDALFPAYQAAVDADSENWRLWLRLGLIYDAAGDRRRARAAIRQAIVLNRGSTQTTPPSQ